MKKSAGILLTLLLLTSVTGRTGADQPEVELQLGLGAGGLKSSLLDVYRSRERFPGSGEIVGAKNSNPVTIYEPALQYLLLRGGWRVRLRISGEIYESPPNDQSSQAPVWNPDTGLFSAQTGTISNMGAYQGEAAVGYEFRSNDSWSITYLLGTRYRQEDFAYESFSLPSGPGVLAFRSYDRRWTSFNMWIRFSYNTGPFELEIEPGWSLWAPGYLRGRGTSFRYDPGAGMTALHEEFEVDTLADIRSVELRALFPITLQAPTTSERDRKSGSEKQSMAFVSVKLEGIHFLNRDLTTFYFGDPEAGNRALIRDASVLNSDRHDFRALLSFGLRFATDE